MAEPVPAAFEESLSPGARALVEDVLRRTGDQSSAPGTNVWLRVILERHGPMVVTLAPSIEPAALLVLVREQLAKDEAGAPLQVTTVLEAAVAHAGSRGQSRAFESDVAYAVLAAGGFTVEGGAAAKATPAAPGAASGPAPPAGAPPAPAAAAPRRLLPTPTLDQFGRDVTKLAREGKLGPVVGREEETELVIETLCRRTTRNPVLVGPAGVGKTAIVEGLAQRIVADRVPGLLAGTRIVELQASGLVAGAHMAGELEERVKTIVREASQARLVLFVDEVHALMGAGGMQGLSDVATQLKPALARGDIACIAATTDDEYRRFIESDRALERRFQPIRIGEPTAAETLDIVTRLAVEFERLRGVTVPAPVQRWIVEFAQQFLRNRCFPAKAVDLLEQCVAHAIVRGATTVDLVDAQHVGHRLIGMPVDLATRRQNLAARLEQEALLPLEDAHTLLARLEVTMRGFDVRAERPNAVILLAGKGAEVADPLCRAVAETLFGAADRMVQMDFGSFVHAEDITRLIGAPPGYVGYSESLPIHHIAQTPWCLLRCDNVHGCHPSVLEVLAQALESGFFTDSGGRRIHLGDVVVVLTAGVQAAHTTTLGFKAAPPRAGAVHDDARHALEAVLGARLLAQCDVIATHGVEARLGDREHLEHTILGVVAERYRREGLELEWDASVVDWLLSLVQRGENALDWERLVDQKLGAELVRYERDTHDSGARRARVKCEKGAVHIEPLTKGQAREGT